MPDREDAPEPCQRVIRFKCLGQGSSDDLSKLTSINECMGYMMDCIKEALSLCYNAFSVGTLPAICGVEPDISVNNKMIQHVERNPDSTSKPSCKS